MEHTLSVQSRIIVGLVALCLEILVVTLLSRRRIREEQALLWFGVGLIVIVLVGSANVFRIITHLLGAEQTVPALILLALVFTLFMLFYFSIKLANLETKFSHLVRQTALNTTSSLPSSRSRSRRRS